MKEKRIPLHFNLSLCHVFVKGRSMHILDIPLARCLTHPHTPLSITLSHFLPSISPEAEGNRAHQTGWSEQNCDWHRPADSLRNSPQRCERTWNVLALFPRVRICMFYNKSGHMQQIFNRLGCKHVRMSVSVAVWVHASVSLYLSSRPSLPEMRGRRRMTSWRKFFAAWRPERAPSAAGLGYWKWEIKSSSLIS